MSYTRDINEELAMFATHDETALPIPSIQPGETFFPFFRSYGEMAWYWVTVGGTETPLSYGCRDPKDWLELLESEDGIESTVQLVSPPWLNRSGGWRLENLIGLTRGCFEVASGVLETGYEYEVDGGRRYCGGALQPLERGEIQQREVIYKRRVAR